MQVLSPSMQHRQKAEPGAQVPGVGGDLQQGFGGRTEENAVNDPLVPQRQRSDQLRHGEYHMEILDRQQLCSTLFEPSRAGLSLTLRAMAIAARAIRNFAVTAPIAFLNNDHRGPLCGRPQSPSELAFAHRRVNLQTSSGKPGRGGGKCRPAPTPARSSHRKQVTGVRQSIEGTDGGAHRQVGNVQIPGRGLEVTMS